MHSMVKLQTYPDNLMLLFPLRSFSRIQRPRNLQLQHRRCGVVVG
jgi:hypothetical protein